MRTGPVTTAGRRGHRGGGAGKEPGPSGGEESHVVVSMHRQGGTGRVPGWVVAVVAATFLVCWYLAGPLLQDLAALLQAVVAFFMLGLLGTAGRYLGLHQPVVFIQDILIELAIYGAVGAVCGAGLSYVAYRWGVAVSPVWPALAVYLVLTLWFDRRGR